MKIFSLWGLMLILLGLGAGCASNPKSNLAKPSQTLCQAYDPKIALILGQLAAASYATKLSQRRDKVKALGFAFDREIQDLDHGTLGFLANNDKLTAVVLAGTEDARDVLKDALVWTQEGKDDPLCGKKVSVHNGFYRALSNIKKDQTLYQRLIQLQKPGRKIYFAGHSLGGALATLMAYFTSLDYPQIQIAAVYTYGQPHTGTRRFQTCYDTRLKDRTFRFVNGDDSIPRIRPSNNYKHVGHPVYFDHNGTIVEEVDFTALNSVAAFIDSPFMNDHDIGEYLKSLEKNRGVNPFACP